MDWQAIYEFIKTFSDVGLALAAWRLATKIDKRFTEHEKEDRKFHKEVRSHLNMPEPVEG